MILADVAPRASPSRRESDHGRSPCIPVLAITLASGLCTGCSHFDYIVRQSISQVGVLVRSVPIDDVLASGKLCDDDARKLRLVVEAREFARMRLGLVVRGSFRNFHDTHGKAMAYNLSATPRDSLSPKRWKFPIIGWIDYIGYFKREDAERAERKLRDEGLDTCLREVDAFSTLGWLPDPVHSPLLKRDDYGLVEVVIHELAHNTVYAAGHSDFNESLATFIGRTGALLFYRERRPDDLRAADSLLRRYEDEDRVNDWLIDLRRMLDEHYARPISSDEKIAARDAVYAAAREKFKSETLSKLHEPNRFRRWADLAPNNAIVRLNLRYNMRQEDFARAYKSVNDDFPTFLDLLRRAAREKSPLEALRNTGDHNADKGT